MSTKRDVVVADFNRSVIPTIVCVNKAKTPLGVKFDDLIPALQEFLDRCFVPVWGPPASVVRGRKTRRKHWKMIFLADAASPAAEGYHDITCRGMPLAKVFVKPTLAARISSASPPVMDCARCLSIRWRLYCAKGRVARSGPTRCATPSRRRHSRSTVAMSDFVFPAYFDLFRLKRRGSAAYDYL